MVVVRDSPALNTEDEAGRVSDKPVKDEADDGVVAKLPRDDSEEVAA
jgi:hypothetical protein